MRLPRGAVALAALLGAAAAPVEAQGHGPIYGLSTPTLGKGAWSVDLVGMGRAAGGQGAAMLRPMVSYGVTEDLQLSASLPVPLDIAPGPGPVRAATRMPATRDVELTLGWRFQRRATGIGARFESTAYLAVDYPTDAVRAGVPTSPALVGAVVTGYASRVIYVWAGGLYRRSTGLGTDSGDHAGDLAMYSLVLGYRPPPFQRDYPHPDWRLFLEVVGEHAAPNVIGGVQQPNSGRDEILAGPTVLGLYGAWGISGGPIFPVYRRLGGLQPREAVRLAVDLLYWF